MSTVNIGTFISTYLYLFCLMLRRDIIVQSARKEFEIAACEQDPLLVMKMIVASREALHNTKEKMAGEILRHQK